MKRDIMKDKLKLKIGDILYISVWYVREERQRPYCSFRAEKIWIGGKETIENKYEKTIIYKLDNCSRKDLPADTDLKKSNIFTTKAAAEAYAKEQLIKELKKQMQLPIDQYKSEIARCQKLIKKAKNISRINAYNKYIQQLTMEPTK